VVSNNIKTGKVIAEYGDTKKAEDLIAFMGKGGTRIYKWKKGTYNLRNFPGLFLPIFCLSPC